MATGLGLCGPSELADAEQPLYVPRPWQPAENNGELWAPSAVETWAELEDKWATGLAERRDECVRAVFAHDGERFVDALAWLFDRSPATVVLNLKHVAMERGWDVVCELVAQTAEGAAHVSARRRATTGAKCAGRKKLLARDATAELSSVGGWTIIVESTNKAGWKGGTRLECARRVLRRYDADPAFRALHEEASRLFAAQLQADTEAAFRSTFADETVELSSACRVAPLPYKSIDKRTLLAEGIARKLFPLRLAQFRGLSEREYAYRARERYRGVLNILREHAKMPERLIGARRFKEIEYERLPLDCLRKNWRLFRKHDTERFAKFRKIPRVELVEKVHPVDAIAVFDSSPSSKTAGPDREPVRSIAASFARRFAEAATGVGRDAVLTFEERPRLMPVDSGLRSLPAESKFSLPHALALLLAFPSPPARIVVFSTRDVDVDPGPAQDLYDARGKQVPELVCWKLSCEHPCVETKQGAVQIRGFCPSVARALAAVGDGNVLAALQGAIEPVVAATPEEDAALRCEAQPEPSCRAAVPAQVPGICSLEGISSPAELRVRPLLAVRAKRAVAQYFGGTQKWPAWVRQVAVCEFGELEALRAELLARVALPGVSVWVDLSPEARIGGANTTITITLRARVPAAELRAALLDVLPAVDDAFEAAAVLLKQREADHAAKLATTDFRKIELYY
jgi:hypothetical protein